MASELHGHRVARRNTSPWNPHADTSINYPSRGDGRHCSNHRRLPSQVVAVDVGGEVDGRTAVVGECNRAVSPELEDRCVCDVGVGGEVDDRCLAGIARRFRREVARAGGTDDRHRSCHSGRSGSWNAGMASELHSHRVARRNTSPWNPHADTSINYPSRGDGRHCSNHRRLPSQVVAVDVGGEVDGRTAVVGECNRAVSPELEDRCVCDVGVGGEVDDRCLAGIARRFRREVARAGGTDDRHRSCHSGRSGSWNAGMASELHGHRVARRNTSPWNPHADTSINYPSRAQGHKSTGWSFTLKVQRVDYPDSGKVTFRRLVIYVSGFRGESHESAVAIQSWPEAWSV